MAYTAKDPPPRRFLYLRETKRCEEGGEEKVSLKTHTTASGVGKNNHKTSDFVSLSEVSRL